MNVVGRVGSIISQGVYSVATPFHPFGGAVDIIVVEQEDGTYRSTPWYVRFGKFQGVLKGAEKVVTIAVNGNDANFHMYLDSSGEAYFLKEISGTNDEESSDQAVNESNHLENKPKHPNSNHGENFEDYMGDLIENKEQVPEDVQLREDEQAAIGGISISSRLNSYNYGNLKEVEDVVESSNDANSEMVLISVDGLVLTAPISVSRESMANLPLDNPQFHLGPGEGPGEGFGSGGDMWEDGLYVDMESHASKVNDALENSIEDPKDSKGVLLHGEHVQNIDNLELSKSSDFASIDKEDMFRSCLDLTLQIQDSEQQGIFIDSQDSEIKGNSKNSPVSSSFNTIIVREASIRENGTEFIYSSIVEMKDLENNTSDDSKQNEDQICSDVAHCNSDMPSDQTLTSMKNASEAFEKSLDIDNMTQESSIEASVNLKSSLECTSEKQVISATEVEINQTDDQGYRSSISGLGFEISLCGNLIRPGMGRVAAEEAFDAHRVSEDEFKTSGQSIFNNGNLIVRYKEMYLPWDKASNLVVGKAVYGSGFSCDIKDQISVDLKEMKSTREDIQGPSSSSSRRWRLWPIPFRRSRTLQLTNSDSSNEELFVDTEPGGQNLHAGQSPISDSNPSPLKQHLRTYIPTTGQIASLNLKDGQNMVAFSFSTRVLGKQQVDAHIYLWKWNARIVISDVDGTITKSDVLGQVMPLVGKDWTQSGVARLFSAIKENGYQLLFLSARAIVQAYLTRSFLLNLKQDGKALPSGPVVISPDGLFPSLFREVIRRAPHEFKIACLEDIRALFPSDYNPFYAGFGNRDTDELSYRKIGIAKGKIFIINPKGEVAINNCIDVKSYKSLHTLVNDMFPPTALIEQEDFNSWNYWKMPLPILDS